MARSGHAIVGWSTSDGAWGTDGGAVAVAAPGGAFGAATTLATLGTGVSDVAVAENGDAFAAWSTSNGVHVAIRQAGGTWGGGQRLDGSGSSEFDLVAGPDGEATVVTGGGALRTWRRSAGETTFSAGPTGLTVLSPVHAGYVGDRVVIAGRSGGDVYALTLAADDTLSAYDHVEASGGSPFAMRLATDRAGGGAALVWPDFDPASQVRAARAGADGAFGDGAKLSGDLYKGMQYPDVAVGPGGRALAGWGDAEFDPVGLALSPSPGAAFAGTAAPPVPGNRTDDLMLGVDSAGADLAGWGFVDMAQNGAAGRVEVASRLPGQATWCRPETLAQHKAAANTLRLRFDGARRGIATWGRYGANEVWVSRYAAREDCPPAPPPAPAEQILREDVVYLPPAGGGPEVVTVTKYVRLSLPRAATADRRGRVRLPVTCTGEEATCAGSLALKLRATTWSSRSFTVAKGRRVVTLTLRPAARRALARRRRAALTAVLRLKGQPVKRATLTLRRR